MLRIVLGVVSVFLLMHSNTASAWDTPLAFKPLVDVIGKMHALINSSSATEIDPLNLAREIEEVSKMPSFVTAAAQLLIIETDHEAYRQLAEICRRSVEDRVMNLIRITQFGKLVSALRIVYTPQKNPDVAMALELAGQANYNDVIDPAFEKVLRAKSSLEVRIQQILARNFRLKILASGLLLTAASYFGIEFFDLPWNNPSEMTEILAIPATASGFGIKFLITKIKDQKIAKAAGDHYASFVSELVEYGLYDPPRSIPLMVEIGSQVDGDNGVFEEAMLDALTRIVSDESNRALLRLAKSYLEEDDIVMAERSAAVILSRQPDDETRQMAQDIHEAYQTRASLRWESQVARLQTWGIGAGVGGAIVLTTHLGANYLRNHPELGVDPLAIVAASLAVNALSATTVIALVRARVEALFNGFLPIKFADKIKRFQNALVKIATRNHDLIAFIEAIGRTRKKINALERRAAEQALVKLAPLPKAVIAMKSLAKFNWAIGRKEDSIRQARLAIAMGKKLPNCTGAIGEEYFSVAAEAPLGNDD